MMNERAAFLKAIFAEPRDDTARLVYADWLQENGYLHYAEFIRLQIKRERTRGGWLEREYGRRERQLLSENRSQWRASYRARRGQFRPFRLAGFHRGLPVVEHVMSSTDHPSGWTYDEYRQAVMEHIRSHDQIRLLVDIETELPPYALSMLNQPILARAQWIRVRPEESFHQRLLPDDFVEAAVDRWRSLPLIHVIFEHVSEKARQLIMTRLAPTIPTLVLV